MRIYQVSLLSLFVFLGACSHFNRSSDKSGIVDQMNGAPPADGYVPNERYKSLDTPHNASVQKWIDYFTGRGRGHMQRYLQRSSRYIPMMKGVFRERGMPDDLAYVAMIESGFSATALSNASAVGYWQFIRGTGKRYSLRIDSYVDERRDPILSTQAAANYLDSLYNLFGDWYLALSGYNAGENRIQRAVMMKRSRDFWELASYKSRRVLPPETRNYIPKFIAAVMIARDPAKYGFVDIDFHPEFEFESLIIEKPVSLDLLAKQLSIDYEELKKMNPRYKSDYVPIYQDRTNAVRVPVGMREKAIAALPNITAEAPRIYAEEFDWYRVRRGDTLSGIAHKHRTSISVIRELNDMNRGKTFIRVGQKLKVPDGPSRGGSKKRAVAQDQRVRTSSKSYHVVRRGETLSGIAEKYGLSLNTLRRLNGLGSRSMIRAGQKLKVAGTNEGASRSTSSSRSRKKYHVVKRGENLSVIAQKYKVSPRELAQKNNIERRSTIFVGSKLIIPQ